MMKMISVVNAKCKVSFVLLFVLCISALAQKKQFTKYGDEAFADGDYFGAAVYYEKAYAIDSSNSALLFKLAESYLNYNAYKKAYPLFQKLAENPQKKDYSAALYHMAMIDKCLEHYDQSAALMARFVKEAKDKSSLMYRRAQQEIKNEKTIPLLLRDTLNFNVYNLAGINSTNAEFSALPYNDSLMYYSALRENKNKEYIVQLYTAQGKGGWWSEDTVLTKINAAKENTGNGTFSGDHRKFIFSRCATMKSCRLMESQWTDSGWTTPLVLPREISVSDSTTTHPFWLNTGGKEFLLFSSNRSGGSGGMDLWYTEYNEGKYLAPKNLGAKVNSPGDEITPFYNTADTSLYFSSNWFAGLGDFDVFRSKGTLTALQEPVNVGIPLNSSRADLNFVIDKTQSGFLSSTRVGTLSDDADAICCTDVYRFEKMAEAKVEPLDTLPFVMEEDYVDLPLVLYFHNDEPNPRCRDTLTRLNYAATYQAYKRLLPDYEKKYPADLKGEDQAMALQDIDRFFEDYVDVGMVNLEKFAKDLLYYLQQGYSAEVVVRGFASPLTKSDYNVNLSLRRISSFINYLKAYENGLYLPYFSSDSGAAPLTIVKQPNGEYKSQEGVSDDYYDVRNSIYHPFAAMERRIEVVSVQLKAKDKKVITYRDDFKKIVVNLGEVSAIEDKHVFLKNTGVHAWSAERVGADCDCVQLKYDDGDIDANHYLHIQFSIDLTGKSGENKNTILLKKSDGVTFQLIEVRYNVVR